MSATERSATPLVSVRDRAGEKSRGCRQENSYYSLEKNSWCKTKKK